MDLVTQHLHAVRFWLDLVDGVADDRWEGPTPCADWNTRELVNHVVGEDLWTVPLLSGATIEQVGDRFDGDLLGADPAAAAKEAGQGAVEVAGATVPSGGTVLLSYGEDSVDNYVAQLVADHLIHGWDLAAATGQDRAMDPELVAAVAAWYADAEESYRAAGVVADRRGSSDDPAEDLLAGFGRDPDWQAPAS